MVITRGKYTSLMEEQVFLIVKYIFTYLRICLSKVVLASNLVPDKKNVLGKYLLDGWMDGWTNE